MKERRRGSLHDVYDHEVGFTQKERRDGTYWIYIVITYFLLLSILGTLMFYYMVMSEYRYGTEFADPETVFPVSVACALFTGLEYMKVIFYIYQLGHLFDHKVNPNKYHSNFKLYINFIFMIYEFGLCIYGLSIISKINELKNNWVALAKNMGFSETGTQLGKTFT